MIICIEVMIQSLRPKKTKVYFHLDYMYLNERMIFLYLGIQSCLTKHNVLDELHHNNSKQ